MKRWIFVAILIPALARAEVYQVNTFGGLDTDNDPALLRQQDSPDADNVVTDDTLGLHGRKGFTKISTVTCSNLWSFVKSDGSKFVIVQDSNTIKADTGNWTFSTKLATVTLSAVTVGAALGDKFFFSNSVDGLKATDGASIVLTSTALNFSHLAVWKGRLWGAGVTSNERTLYGSKLYDGTTFALTTTNSDDDPTQVPLAGALNENISGIFGSFEDKLMWFKPHSFGELSGSRRSNFTLRTISDVVGTSYPDSIQDCDGELRWLGPNRFVYGLQGGAFQKISEPVDNLLATIVQGDAATRSANLTSQTDFTGGDTNQSSIDISPGDVVPSTWTTTETGNTAFLSNGGFTHIRFSVGPSSNYSLDFAAANLVNNSFESGSGSTADNWTTTGSAARDLVPSGVGPTPYDGSHFMFLGNVLSAHSNALTVLVLSTTGATLQSTLIYQDAAGLCTTTPFSANLYSVNLSAFTNRNIKVQFVYTNSDPLTQTVTSDLFFCDGNTLFFRIAENCASSARNTYLDALTGGRDLYVDGTFHSQAFDTGLPSPTWQPTTVSTSTGGGSIIWTTEVSADNSSWDSPVTWTPGFAPASASKRYIRYTAFLSTGSNSATSLPAVSLATLAATESTAAFVTPSVFTNANITSWSNIALVDTSAPGTMTYGFYTDSDSAKSVVNGVPVAGTYLASQTITNAQIPTVATAAYAFLTVNFTSSTNVFRAVTFAWGEGAQSKLCSAYPSQRYWLSVAISSSANNRILVYDRNHNWLTYSGINATAMTLYNSTLYFGNSGGIFQGENGYTDDGSEITGKWTTKALAPAGLDAYFQFDKMFLTTAHSESAMDTSYFVNEHTTEYQLSSKDMDEQNGVQNFMIPFPNDGLQQGKTLSIKWSVTGPFFWHLLNANLYYRPEKEPEE